MHAWRRASYIHVVREIGRERSKNADRKGKGGRREEGEEAGRGEEEGGRGDGIHVLS